MGILPKALAKVFTEDDYDREISDYYRAKAAQQDYFKNRKYSRISTPSTIR